MRPGDSRLALPAAERLRVHEIYVSIQGESTRAGRRCVFVRLTGCQMRCVWCDTAHAFYDGSWRSVDEVLDRVAGFQCALVEVTGGEPLLQPGALTLLRRLADRGYEVLLETGGGLPIEPVDPRVRRVLDIKCPGSGESEHNLWSNLLDLRATDEVKFVLADETDYDWAARLVREMRLDEICPVHFSPVHGRLPPAELAAWILRDRLAVRLSTQLHRQIWPDADRGV